MVAGPPSREKETRELIERLKARRRRRHVLGVVSASLGVVLVVGLIVAAVVLITRGSEDDAGAGSTSSIATPTSTSAADMTPSSTQSPATTYHRVSSTTTEGAPDSTTTTFETTTTTSAPPSSTTSTSSTTTLPISGLVVCIDPGHQAKGDSSTEPIGPGSSQMKAKTSDGTASVNTGAPESELVLAVSLKLRDALVVHGITVVMTRTTQDVRLSNVQRAQIANDAGADLFIRVHADGSENHSINGIHVLYPASIKGWTDDIAAASKQAATLAQKELIAATGATDRGIDARSDLTGFNWSDVPVILPEIGFMTNPTEDKLLATPAYQDKIVAGLTRAVLAFLGAD